jgi:hypothetical protein
VISFIKATLRDCGGNPYRLNSSTAFPSGSGRGRFYERMIPVADKLYDMYIEDIRKEGLIP